MDIPATEKCEEESSPKNKVDANEEPDENKPTPEKPIDILPDADILTKYNHFLDTNPVLTKSLTAAVVQGFGAALGSILSSRVRRREEVKSLNWSSIFAFALHGGFVNGPIGHYWFDWLAKNGPKSSLKSMLIDQLIFQPPLLLFMFVFIDSTEAALKEIRPSLARNLSTIRPKIVNSWKFWPCAVLATFRFLKKKHYTVALNLFSLAWTIYLSKNG